MPKLRSYVHVTDDKGYTFVFGPDSDVPAWAQKKIVNPDAWADAPAAEVAPEAPAPKVDVVSPIPAEAPKKPARRTRKTTEAAGS